MTYTIETILAVPSYKLIRMRKYSRDNGHEDDTLVVSPGNFIGDHIPRFILLDTELKNEWGFGTDQWFHEILLARADPKITESILWVKEDNDAEA
jgi:hypothetical protein